MLKSAELIGTIGSLQQTISTAPDAGFAPEPLTTQFCKAVAGLTALGAQARAQDPATPESLTARELMSEIQPKLFATGGILFAKAMRANPDSPHNGDILGHLALLKHRSAAQTSALNKSWLLLSQYHALRGNFAQSAQVAQDAMTSESPFATGETQAQNQLTAAAIWNGRGKSPFGKAYDAARREQFIRQVGHSATRSFIKALLITTAIIPAFTLLAGTGAATYLGAALFGFSGTGALLVAGTTVVAAGAGLRLLGKAVMRRADPIIKPIAPQVEQVKKFTLSKISGTVLGISLGITAGYNLVEAAAPPVDPEPVYYKKQSPQPKEKRDDWQKSAKFKLVSPSAGQGPRAA
jgi:hypothetical protein